MQRALLVATLLAVACASSGHVERKLSVELTERSGAPRTADGPHYYNVRLRNVSEGPINIESIQLDPPDTAQLEVEGASLWIGETIAPGNERTYQLSLTVMPATVMPERGTMLPDHLVPDLSSLRVRISCSDQGGTFLVDETVNLNHSS